MSISEMAYLDDLKGLDFSLPEIPAPKVLQEFYDQIFASYLASRDARGSTQRLAALSAKVEALSSLRADWDSYGSPPPIKTAVDASSRALEIANVSSFLPIAITPASDGGITMSWGAAGRHAYLELCNDGGAISAMYDDTSSDPIVSEFEPSRLAIQNALIAFRKYIES